MAGAGLARRSPRGPVRVRLSPRRRREEEHSTWVQEEGVPWQAGHGHYCQLHQQALGAGGLGECVVVLWICGLERVDALLGAEEELIV